MNQIDRLPDLEPMDLVRHGDCASGVMLGHRTASQSMGWCDCSQRRFVKAESFNKGQRQSFLFARQRGHHRCAAACFAGRARTPRAIWVLVEC
ncbi:MAG TPA: hypothetical protein VHX43_00665 [Xanthobacteraceae bacterium]|nr:hypothetical protein [Xanthobacteraceae bacterium]